MVAGAIEVREAGEPVPAEAVKLERSARRAGALERDDQVCPARRRERRQVVDGGHRGEIAIVVVQRQRISLGEVGDFGISRILDTVGSGAAVEVQHEGVGAGAAGELGKRGIRHRDGVVRLRRK